MPGQAAPMSGGEAPEGQVGIFITVGPWEKMCRESLRSEQSKGRSSWGRAERELHKRLSGTSVGRDPCGLWVPGFSHLEEIIPAKSPVPWSSIARPSENITTCLTRFCSLSNPYILHPALQSLQESTGDESLGKTVELHFLRFVLGKPGVFLPCPPLRFPNV